MSLNTTFFSRSEAETRRFASDFSAHLQPGAVVGLIGELGAGKSCFVRGLARGLGVPEDVPITSPTFTVMNVYTLGRIPLYHFDLYRLADVDELEAVGFRDYLGSDGIAVLEWADRIPDALPTHHVMVRITDGDTENTRVIVVEAH